MEKHMLKKSFKMSPTEIVSSGCKCLRKIIKFFKENYGNNWVDELHKQRKNIELNNVYNLSIVPYKSKSKHIGRVCDILYGLYFNPTNWKKGMNINFSINSQIYDGETFKDSTYNWSIILNNEDGFYPYCFGILGFFQQLRYSIV